MRPTEGPRENNAIRSKQTRNVTKRCAMTTGRYHRYHGATWNDIITVSKRGTALISKRFLNAYPMGVDFSRSKSYDLVNDHTLPTFRAVI